MKDYCPHCQQWVWKKYIIDHMYCVTCHKKKTCAVCQMMHSRSFMYRDGLCTFCFRNWQNTGKTYIAWLLEI